MKSAIAVATAVLAASCLGIPRAAFAESGASDAALADALKKAELPLERGLVASSREGMPISAKYELFEDDYADELRLIVYTMRDESGGTMKAPAFAKVIVDYTTGKIDDVV